MNRPQSPKTPSPRPAAPEGERLQKLIAATGLGSRRAIEDWIRAGRVTLDGIPAQLGDRARPGQRIEVDGREVEWRTVERCARVILYHKPVGELVTRRDPRGRPTVFDHLPVPPSGKWIAVGRLDYNTSGLLLLTDSGDLANTLMHPRYGLEREYSVRVQGELDPQQMRALRTGVDIGGERARFEHLEAAPRQEADGVNRWYRAVLTEGRNREVRRLMEAVGRRVSRLIRVRYGPVELPRDLRAGAWFELPAARVESLAGIARKGKIR